jgi:hypothetical protein
MGLHRAGLCAAWPAKNMEPTISRSLPRPGLLAAVAVVTRRALLLSHGGHE